MVNFDQVAAGVRQALLAEVDPSAQPIPAHPYVAFVWPTELCSIGCAHCSFGSKKNGSQDKRLLADHPEELVQWLSDAGAHKVVVCGGGEPLEEPDFVRRCVAACARAGLKFEIYTSGVALNSNAPVAAYISEWSQAWRARVRQDYRFHVRLSVDTFHEDRIGLEPVVEWIEKIEQTAPDWSIAIRGLRVIGDDSIERLAARLGGELRPIRDWYAWMILPSGRKLLVERKGFVVEGRGRLRVLQRRGLQLTSSDREALLGIASEADDFQELGRPLSVRLTVTHQRLDLEIHSDAVVHILESQATDLRMSLLETPWTDVKGHYYRDPILHRVVEAGLPGVALLLSEARRLKVASDDVVPYSIEKLVNPAALAWVTAAAIETNSDKFVYTESVCALARKHLRLISSYSFDSNPVT